MISLLKNTKLWTVGRMNYYLLSYILGSPELNKLIKIFGDRTIKEVGNHCFSEQE